MPALLTTTARRVPSIAVNAAFCVVLLLSVVTTSFAQDRFFTGRRFQRQLDAPASIFWSDVELETGLQNLAEARRMSVWLDRRCDPQTTISFGANLPRLRDCLWKLANDVEPIDVVWLPEVLYVAPPNAANRLATVHEIHRTQLNKLPATVRNRWLSRAETRWPQLSNPVELLAKLETELGGKIRNKDRIVHDLWPAKRLPRMPLYQRLELVLAGYDLTFTFGEDGGATIITMPKAPTYSRATTIPDDKLEVVQKALSKNSTRAALKDGKLTASWRTHEAVRRIVDPPSKEQDFSRIRYTLKAENQKVGTFLRSICKQLNLTCKFVDVPEEIQNTRVSFEVNKASLRTLFNTILEPVGLEFSLANSELEVRTKPAQPN